MDYLAAAGIGGLIVLAALGWGMVMAGRGRQEMPVDQISAQPPRSLPSAAGPQRPPSAAAEAQRELFRVVAAARRTA